MPAGSHTRLGISERTLVLNVVVLFLTGFIAGSQTMLVTHHRIIVDLLRKYTTASAVESPWDVSFDDCRCSVLQMRPDLSKHCVDDFRITLDRTAILASELIQLYLFPSLFLRKFSRRPIISRAFLVVCVLIVSSTVWILFINTYLHHDTAFIILTSGAVLFAYVVLYLHPGPLTPTFNNNTNYRIRHRSPSLDVPLIPLVDKSWRALL